MTAIAIFVKTPGLSPVKTRLARGIGEARAIELYRQCAAVVMAVARSTDTGPVYCALAESTPDAIQHWHEYAPVIHQGDGDLGERMGRVMNTLVERHGSGLLLGADAPQLEGREIRRAADWLSASGRRSVIGPARDGGFWVFGSNQAIEEHYWTRVAYSRPDTFSQFTQSMDHETEWLELPVLTDLDTAADLAALTAELQGIRHPLPAQTRLVTALAAAQNPGSNPSHA
jgi:uncharacterized protein